jgi:hypothetical protein
VAATIVCDGCCNATRPPLIRKLEEQVFKVGSRKSIHQVESRYFLRAIVTHIQRRIGAEGESPLRPRHLEKRHARVYQSTVDLRYRSPIGSDFLIFKERLQQFWRIAKIALHQGHPLCHAGGFQTLPGIFHRVHVAVECNNAACRVRL